MKRAEGWRTSRHSGDEVLTGVWDGPGAMAAATPQENEDFEPLNSRQEVLRELATLKWKLVGEFLRNAGDPTPTPGPPLWRVLSESGVTLSELSLLALLLGAPGGVSHARRHIGFTPQAAVALIDRMERRGLIHRISMPEQKEIQYGITLSGRRRLQSISSRMRAELFRSLSDVSAEQLETLIDAVRFFLSAPGLRIEDDRLDAP